jgi:5-formyltetrahydrofolate cyclo-ligase
MNKAELRKLYLAKRLAIEPERRKLLSAKIADHLFREVDFSGFTAVHCYLSLEKSGEPDTAPILRRLWMDYPAIKTFAPRVVPATDEIQSIEITSESQLAENLWGIPEPLEGQPADPAIFDCVVVPLICCDVAGHRVGYGKGFYDRFLSRCRSDCLKIGLSFFPPVVEISDVHPWDVPIDFCITPAGIFGFKPDFSFSTSP